MKNKSLLKPTIQVTFFSFVGILFSFANQLAVAYFFGASPERDAYFAAMAIPTYLSAIFSGSVCMIFLPKYVDVLQKEGQERATRFLGNTLGFSALITFAIVFLITVFAAPVLSVSAPGFDSVKLELTKKILIILLPTFIFQMASSLLGSVLQVNHKFIIPSVAPIFGAMVSLVLVLILSKVIGIKSLAFGTLVSSIVVLVVICYSLHKLNFGIRLRFNFSDEDLKSLMLISMPLFFGGIVYRLSPVFERMIGSRLPQGSISYLGYANQFLAIIATITTSGIATTIFPRMSKDYSENNINSLRSSFIMAIGSILIVVLPIAIVFYMFGVRIVQLLFERGAFTHDVTLAVYSTFVILLGALVFQSLGNIIMRILYLSKKTVFATIIATTEIAVYLFGAMWLCRYYTYKGLAFAQSFSTGITFLLAMIVINSQIFKFGPAFFKSIAKVLVSNLILFLFLFLANQIWNDLHGLLSIVIKTSAGFTLMYYVLIKLKVQEILHFKNIITTKIGEFFNYKSL